MRSRIHSVFLLLFLLSLFTVPAHAQGNKWVAGFNFNPADQIRKIAEKQLRDMLTKALGADVPLKLDQSTAFAEAAPPGNFTPHKLTKLSDLNRPLPPGDYAVDAQFYCTEYSIHRPPAGLPYKIGRTQGRLVKPMCALLNRGTLQGVSPFVLEADAWRIQAGVPMNQWPSSDQAVTHKLIPDYENTLQGDYIQQIQNDYDKSLKLVLRKPFDEELTNLGDLGQQVLQLEKARQILSNQSFADDRLPDMLYQATGDGGNPVLASDNSSPSPWMQVRPGVVGRYTIIGGYLQKNLFEFRVGPDATAAGLVITPSHVGGQFRLANDTQKSTAKSPSLAQIMNMDESDWSDGEPDLISYSIAQAAQAAIIPAILQGIEDAIIPPAEAAAPTVPPTPQQQPQVEIDVNLNPDSSNGVVLLDDSVEAQAKLTNPQQNDISITLTTSNPNSNSGSAGQATLSSSTIGLPKDGTPVKFEIRGTNGSSTIGDVELDAIYSGQVVGSGYLTVCYFTNPVMTIRQGNPYKGGKAGKNNEEIAIQPQPLPAVKFESHADIMPNGVKATGPLKDLNFGIVQNIESTTLTCFYHNPHRINIPKRSKSVRVPGKFYLTEVPVGAKNLGVGWLDTKPSIAPLYDKPGIQGTLDPASLQLCDSTQPATSRDSPNFSKRIINDDGKLSVNDIAGNAGGEIVYEAYRLDVNYSFMDWCVLYDEKNNRIVKELCSSSWSLAASTSKDGSIAIVQNSNQTNAANPNYTSIQAWKKKRTPIGSLVTLP